MSVVEISTTVAPIVFQPRTAVASPVGHSLLGIAFAATVTPRGAWSLRWLLFVVFAANAADLDFLPGIVIGDVNRFHHGPSHSLAAAILFAIICIVIARCVSGTYNTRIMWTAFLAYTSHLIGDYLGADFVDPRGIPLFWPVSNEYYISAVALFPNVEHGSRGDGIGAVITEVFSLHNVMGAALETAITLPLILLVLWFGRRRDQSQR